MDMHPPAPHETSDHEKSFVSKNVLKAAVISATVGGAAYLLYRFRKIFRHTVPPIIIRSTEEANTPIDIATENILDETESPSGQGAIAGLPSMLYKMKDFKLTKYVAICAEQIGSTPVKVYESDAGLQVKIWLQKYEFKEWRWEIDGPHLIIEGTSPDFSLTCAQLSPDTDNLGNNDRPQKRFFSVRKKWRIGKVQVGDDEEIEVHRYATVEIHFDNHFDHP